MDAVSEPIALELRQQTSNIYLHAQIYTGFMYVAAALCMWLLRAWKIGEIEEIAAVEEKPPGDIDALHAEPTQLRRTASRKSGFKRSSILKRLFVWKKV